MTVKLKTCRKCKSRFIGSIDENGWFCSMRCKTSYVFNAKDILEEERNKKKEDEKSFQRKQSLASSSRCRNRNHKKKVKIKKIKRKSGFYSSEAWMAVRYRAIKLYGRKCMACGAANVEIHVDHIKPRSRHPALALEITNLQILCKPCNFGKSNTDETDWRSK